MQRISLYNFQRGSGCRELVNKISKEGERSLPQLPLPTSLYSEFSPTSTLQSIKIRSPFLPSSMLVRRLILWTTESFFSTFLSHTDSPVWVHMVGVLHHWSFMLTTATPGFFMMFLRVQCYRTGFIRPLCTSDVAKLVEALGLGAHLYADDTQLYGHCSPSNSSELASRVLRAIDSIHEWMFSNRLSLSQPMQDTIRLSWYEAQPCL